MSKPLIGIEIGDSEVRMVQRHSDRVIVAAERMPEDLVKNNKIMSPELLAQFIKKMKKSARFKGKDCAVILPEFSTFFRTVTSPPVSEAQLKLNLPYEFRDFVGSEGVAYYYDYSVERVVTDEEGNPESIELIAAAAQKTVVAEYAALIKHAGLRLKVALPREMAVINLMRKTDNLRVEKSKEYCLIGIGYEHTRVYIFAKGMLQASKTIDVGCRHIDEAIAGICKIDTYLAASYRETDHMNMLSEPECSTVYERIALEIMKVINFYKYENPQTELNDAYFFSEGADIAPLTAEILEYIQFEMGDIYDVLPERCEGVDNAGRGLLAFGITM